MKRGGADCGQFRARTRSGSALEWGKRSAGAGPEEGSAASRSGADAKAPRGRHRDGRTGGAAQGGRVASSLGSGLGTRPKRCGHRCEIARSSRSPKRRTSTGDACTSPGDLQNMIPRSREVGRRAGARRSARRAGVRTGRTFADRRARPRPGTRFRIVETGRGGRLIDLTDNGHFRRPGKTDRSRGERERDAFHYSSRRIRGARQSVSHLFLPLPLNTSLTAMCASGTP